MKINLIEYFENTVFLFPHKLALSDATSQHTFIELKEKSIALSSYMTARHPIVNKPVAIFLPKTNDSIICFLASLYSGNCYAPMDVKNPINRIEAILRNLDPICVLTNSKHIPTLLKCQLTIDIINIDDLNFEPKDETSLNYTKCIDTDPAYIIHTSGSTGIPKGVAISHRSIFDYINWAIETFNITENEVIGNQAPFIFDNSTLDIYLMIFTGATLHLIPEALFMFPIKLLEYINTYHINFVFWVPSVFMNVSNLKLFDSIKLHPLKKVLFAGEVMPTKTLNYWISNLDKNTLFANLYGPTEITVDCTFFIVNRSFQDNEILPIGKPCRNSDILILNEHNKMCQEGEKGELCVRGTSLALGYWNDVKKTNTAFCQNPLNNYYPEKIYRTGDIVFTNKANEIIFVGRKDNQVKHLGYRIELGEIEHCISHVFDSLACCVLYRNEEITLVYESKQPISKAEFRSKLAPRLSKYMVPTKFIRIDKIPLTLSGKIDRQRINKNYE